MKWCTKDYKGDECVWYSKDVIEKIKYICKRMPYNSIEKILKIIEEEDEC